MEKERRERMREMEKERRYNRKETEVERKRDGGRGRVRSESGREEKDRWMRGEKEEGGGKK